MATDFGNRSLLLIATDVPEQCDEGSAQEAGTMWRGTIDSNLQLPGTGYISDRSI